MRHLSKQRRLPGVLKRKAEDLLSMKVNKKILQQKLSAESGQVVTLRDLTNISAKMKRAMSRNDLQHVVQILETEYGKSIVPINLC